MADRLDYLADMAAELQDIAQTAGCETLAAILGAAVVEARRQSNQRAAR